MLASPPAKLLRNSAPDTSSVARIRPGHALFRPAPRTLAMPRFEIDIRYGKTPPEAAPEASPCACARTA
jgi:hypothetical protein